MMTISNGNGAVRNTQTVQYNMGVQQDSFSKNIQDQITNAQKQLQEISANQDLTPEEKMKKRQEIQQEITNLNQQLRQHQIEQRKEQQSKIASEKENNKNSQKTDTQKQQTGLSSTSMEAMISADSSIKQARVQGSVATQMEDRAGVLKTEIKLDGSRGGDTSAKEAELAEVEQKAENATNSQLNTLAEANRTMAEATETDSADDKVKTESADGKTEKEGNEAQQAGEISDNGKEDTDVKDVKDVSQSPGVSAAAESMATETAETDSRPTAKKHIDIYL